jgi:hypothetical protein
VFSGSAVEHYVIAAVREVQKTWRHLGVTGPIVVGVTLMGLRGAGIALDRDVHGLPGAPLARDPFVLPEVEVDDLETTPEMMLPADVRPALDAGGIAGSPNYRDGIWQRR